MAESVTGVMAEPVTSPWLPGLATDTVLATVQVKVADPEAPVESVAVSVTEQVHGAVGVPLIVPVDELIERPAGRPVADHVKDVMPDSESVAELVTAVMAVPVTADVLPGFATVTVLVIVHVKVAVPDWLDGSVAVNVTEQVHGVVGVPVTVPVDELIERPAGRPVADHV